MVYKQSRDSWVARFSEGLLATSVDLALYSIFFTLEFGIAGYGKGARAGEGALRSLEDFNYQAIKRSFTYLRQKGFTETFKREMALPRITAAGKKRMESIVPQYDRKRAWDGRIYIITYDLPVKRNSDRNYLRDFLKKIGCGMLQRSVWLTPYNPNRLIQKFVEEKNLKTDLILVSSLGKGETFGERTLEELMERVYYLEDLNERYQNFIFQAREENQSRTKLIFNFLSILKEDPQLPYKLVPEYWAGDKAYQLFQKVVKEK